MIRSLKKIALTLGLVVVSTVVQADTSVESLSPELRTLLGKEMQALQKGMQAIIPAYASGHLEEVARIAEKMNNSYILKQNITDNQKQELMSKMPKSFLYLDQKFHEYAAKLEHVAKEEHIELVGFYFYKLAESCANCHSQYGTDKFPNFRAKPGKKDHHH